MKFRLWSALFLFLGSYLPLAVILLVQDVSEKYWGAPLCMWGEQADCTFQVLDHPRIAITCVIITLLALLITLSTIKAVPLKHQVEVVEVKSIPNDLINYVFPYVVSFMGLSYADPQGVAGFAVFMAVLFIIALKSGQILMNPLLIVLGWSLSEAKILVGKERVARTVRVLKRGVLLPGVQYAEKVQDVYLMEDS